MLYVTQAIGLPWRGVCKELAMLEVIYDDLDNDQISKDPDEVRCT